MPSRLKAALATVHPLAARSAEPSDAALVARSRAGDVRAEEALYLRHVGYVTSLCMRLLGNREEAEDAAQDTFLDVLQQLGSLRDPERLKQWITRVAVHKAHRRFRRRKLLRALGLYGAEHDVNVLAAAAHSTSEQAAELERLSQVLGALPVALREDAYAKLAEPHERAGDRRAACAAHGVYARRFPRGTKLAAMPQRCQADQAP